MIRSFRFRLLLCSAILLVIFLILLMPIIRDAFDRAVRQFSSVRLEQEANDLITAVKTVDGDLTLPDTLNDLGLKITGRSGRVGYFYTQKGNTVLSNNHSVVQQLPDLQQAFSKESQDADGAKADFRLSTDSLGRHYYVYDREVNLGGPDLSVITMEPVTEYDVLRTSFLRRFELWLLVMLCGLLVFLAVGLTWIMRPLRRLEKQLTDIEQGKRELLDENVPSEIQRLIRSLNRMLTTERMQRERYQDTLGDLAHSLKTPLTVLQNILDEVKKDTSLQQLPLMQSQIDRMGQQIGYQLQRATQRKSALIGRKIALQPLIESLIVALSKVYADKQVEVEINLSETIEVHAEEAALLELFGNLLENAYRLCLNKICINSQLMYSKVIITLEDDGPGVPFSKRKLVLQRGMRGDSLNPGQGIGLAVVQDILEGYNGYLEIDDSVLGGANFRVHLPV